MDISKSSKSKFCNYIRVEGDGKNYPRLYCPVCGKRITPDNEGCPHLLFECAYSDFDSEVAVNYVHAKFKKTIDDLSDELHGTAPEDLMTKLMLDPDSTFVLTVENLFSAPGCSGLCEIAVGLEFPPGSLQLKAYKRSLGRKGQDPSGPQTP